MFTSSPHPRWDQCISSEILEVIYRQVAEMVTGCVLDLHFPFSACKCCEEPYGSSTSKPRAVLGALGAGRKTVRAVLGILGGQQCISLNRKTGALGQVNHWLPFVLPSSIPGASGVLPDFSWGKCYEEHYVNAVNKQQTYHWKVFGMLTSIKLPCAQAQGKQNLLYSPNVLILQKALI